MFNTNDIKSEKSKNMLLFSINSVDEKKELDKIIQSINQNLYFRKCFNCKKKIRNGLILMGWDMAFCCISCRDLIIHINYE